ncbi:predicted protein [Histoplasma mississippiense (nom. inval.)]|uniref:predicted protein n=1 Tax=Ajellomyces capsulatus (strain NAm1 / WU24) TaxID=2059318 RepID=UPI000157BEF8|nr:predicted protein [Histoplasma mississippiense (nom. inval.)]EDN06477.1 predicted protein [Histoplasma mississippiense (nom. inval.)]
MMESLLRFTERETRLATERRLKFQGTAKVDLDQIFFDPQSSRQLDHKNVDRLCRIFQEEGCQSMPLAHRVPAAVSRQNLAAALQRANVSARELLTNPEPEMPHLRFPPGKLQGLHGRHRIAAGLEVLSPAHRCWVVDVYSDDIGDDLKTSLIEEYSNEKPPSDGEIYRRIRQYVNDGNLHGELRWKARLCSNSQTRLQSLFKNTRLRHAFDGVLGIPGHRNAMRISMLHRVMGVSCDEDFWFSLVDDDPASVAKIDQHTVETLQLMVPRSEAKVVRGLVTSGQIFTDFDEDERDAIWEKLRSFGALVPSLNSFFEDFKCFESWAHCLTRLFTLGKSTVRQTMDGLWTTCSDGGNMCPVQTSESAFDSRREPVGRQFDLAYRQMWLYAMRHYPQMPRDPKRKNRLAKAQNATADECVVSDMASLARRLGFRSSQITNLVNQAPDRLIAEQALLKARKPEYFSYDDTQFDTLIDRIVECFAVATPRDVRAPSVLVDRSVKRKARCGHPTMEALEQDRPLLFVDHMQAAAVPDRVTTFFVRCCVYFAFFGPQPSLRQGADNPPSSVPMSPLFVSENSPIDGPSEARGHEYIIQHPQDDGRNGIPPGPGSQGSAVAMDTDEREAMWTDIATEWTAEERASEAHMAETARLQQIAEDMDRRARVAEEKAASHAAELARVQKEADERAARAAEQVRAQRDAEQAVQQVHRQEETESMARRAREAEDRVAAQAAELERLRKGATERAVQGAEHTLSQVDHDGSATVLAQLQNETLEGLAEPAPENIPLPLDDDTTMAEPTRPVTQLDVSSSPAVLA